MDLFDVAKSCVRRWYVFLPLMVLVGIFSYSTYSGVQPVYYGSATLGLAPPSVSNAPDGREVRSNALLATGGVTLLSNLLALGLSDASVHQHVVAQGGLPDYTANVFAVPGGQLPLVVISVTSPDATQVTKTLQIVAAQGEETLQGLQQGAGVPDDQLLRTYTLGTIGDPVPAMPSRLRTTVTVFVAGAGLAVILSVLADVFFSRRRERAHSVQTNTAEPGTAGGKLSSNNDHEHRPSAAVSSPGMLDT